MGLCCYCPGCHPYLPPRPTRHLRRRSRRGVARGSPSHHCTGCSCVRRSRGPGPSSPGSAGTLTGQTVLQASDDNLVLVYLT